MPVHADPPIVCRETWAAVMERHHDHCHACPQLHGTPAIKGKSVTVHLVVGPPDPTVDALTAARTPVDDLVTWCPACWRAAQSTARKATKAAPPQDDALFVI